MTWMLALLIGLMAGYGAVEGRGNGMLIVALVLVVLPVLYYRQGRLPDIGFLFVGVGALPILFLGPALLGSFTDGGTPAPANALLIVVAACFFVIVGVLILVAVARMPRGGT